MYIHIYICIYTYIHTCICECIYLSLSLSIYTYTYIYISYMHNIQGCLKKKSGIWDVSPSKPAGYHDTGPLLKWRRQTVFLQALKCHHRPLALLLMVSTTSIMEWNATSSLPSH